MKDYHRGRGWMGLLLILSLCVAVMGNGCESIPQPQTVRQGIAYGYTTVTAAREQATTLLNTHSITKAEAEMVQNVANAARGALDIADSYAKSGDMTRAQQSLTVAQESLKQLTIFMNARK